MTLKHLIAILIGAAGALILIQELAQPDPGISSEEYLHRALDRRNRGDWYGAQKWVDQALEQDSEVTRTDAVQFHRHLQKHKGVYLALSDTVARGRAPLIEEAYTDLKKSCEKEDPLLAWAKDQRKLQD